MYKKIIPQRIKDSIKVLIGRSQAVPISYSSGRLEEPKYFCPVCKSPVEKFNRLPDFYNQNLDKYGYIFSIFQSETMNRLGYSCPVCGASDRCRLYALYFQEELLVIPNNFKLLDFAPSTPLSNLIKANYPNINYRSADLMMPNVDDIVDLTDMSIYEDSSFDFFICSHVLEHVLDDRKAMSELYRILKPGHRGIVMVPILLSLSEDYENPEITTPEGRWKHFGQDDHVRMYSKPGFVNKLISTGFIVHQYDIDYFGKETFEKYGIHPRSVLYIVEK